MYESTIINPPQHASKILQQKKTESISAFFKKNIADFMEDQSQLLDNYFCESFERSVEGPKIGIDKNPYIIIAQGGYGRKEQCIHSDIDVLFLFKKRIPNEAEALVREMVYPLWDIGLSVGYAVRTMRECLNLASKDFEVLTALLDARLICGVSNFFLEFMTNLRENVIFKRSDKIVNWLVERTQERHQLFGDATYLLEPHLKEGQGGLRDYHALLWISKIKFTVKMPRDLEYNGFLSYDEFQTLQESLSFIWKVRNCLHHLTGRKYDHLHLEHQPKIADSLKYTKVNGQEPVEKFLGDLHEKMEFIKQKYLTFQYELGHESKWLDFKNRFIKQITTINGLYIHRNMLYFTSPEDILHSPELLIKIFEESARLKILLSAESKRLIKEFSYLIDENFRKTDSVVQTFERILSLYTPGFNVLDEMLSTGFLVHFIPEFKEVINRIEYDEYHVHSVDKHLLCTVQTVKQLGTSEKPSTNVLCKEIYNELTNKNLLLWAALLHDIGKGEPTESHSHRGAKLVQSILSQKGIKSEDVETVSFLVQEHLFLIKTATRRDINDEETVILCAGKITDIERLKMLYLLTVADFTATGPKAWNEWVAVLLRELFLKVLNILEKGELASHKAYEIVRKKEADVVTESKSEFKSDIESLFMVMSQRYLLYTPSADIKKHIRLYKSMGNADFVWDICKASNSNTRTITVCSNDRPDIFSKIAGVFTLNSIDILDAQIYTWRNNIALGIFNVQPPPDPIFENEQWDMTHNDMQLVLSGKLNLAEALEKKMTYYRSFKPRTSIRSHKIMIDNHSSSFFTIIEVHTYDVCGLLFKITDALFRCKLNICSAQITTKVDQAVDVFYVKDFDGQKADSPNQEPVIKSAIEEILPGRQL